ncbi:polyketide synthase [Corynespora cassiicola Philippines]|uniref:Polyketide synthase n=1 Tax=Corynespora cassiicola Philippines TaxID=1448308 RepID=A0A2T2N5L3_CORCC|nr:polyketide synthase [Corynespora cassiicola Philippines]
MSNHAIPPPMDENSGYGHEPVAIIGMSCRFSGMADTPDEMLITDSNLIPSGTRKANSIDPGVHLLSQDPAAFDNDFFNISGLEAKAMDPQQRLMLEVAYETFENAGISLEKLEKSETAVYCASSYQDYDQILGRDPEVSASYRFTGTGASLLANRLSYFFDLRGPSITIDTACSSTLVALHEACRAIRIGDASQAFVGGANLILDPDKLMVQSSMQFLSQSGRCFSFDSRASGYGRGEGIVGILLKPLSAALADGDSIRAVIRGTSVVSDGRTLGITMPSMESQTRAILKAYENAGLRMAETPYIEAHGTGTTVGDKAEAMAFSATIGKERREKIIVGSVKSNLGHIENASGLASVAKIILALENGIIPPNPTWNRPSEQLALDEMGIIVPTSVMPWPAGALKRASVNSTGYGGTTCHAIIEAASTVLPTMVAPGSEEHPKDKLEPSRTFIFPLSHHQDGGVAKWARKLKRHLIAPVQNIGKCNLEKLAFTLSCRRSHLQYKTAIVASSIEELCGKLDNILDGSIRETKSESQPTVCFVFTGQGAQWAGMGQQLLPAYPVFAHAMKTAEEEFIRLGADWNLIPELLMPPESSIINEAHVAQPSCTALQIALIDLLATWNIRPTFLCGHSSGEIAAAYAAGILTREDALRVAYFRGSAVALLKKLHPDLQGSMLAVGLSEIIANQLIEEFSDQVVVACVNSPSSVTLSGDKATLQKLQSRLDREGTFNRMLAVDVAYHSHHIARVHQEYISSISGIYPHPAKETTHVISSVTGLPIKGSEMTAEYWARNLTNPVRFSDAMNKMLSTISEREGALAEVGPNVLIEIGPHAALGGPIAQITKACKGVGPTGYLSALVRNVDATRSVLELVEKLFAQAVRVCLNKVNHPLGEPSRAVLTELPPYYWHHNKLHWQESRRSKAYRFRELPRHDLLGTPTADSIKDEPTWRNYLRPVELPWLTDHCISGQAVFPAAGYVTMVIESLKEIYVLSGTNSWKNSLIRFRGVTFVRPLIISQTDPIGVETFLHIRPQTQTEKGSSPIWKEFRVFSSSYEAGSTEHCRGLVSVVPNWLLQTPVTQRDESQENWKDLSPSKFYNEIRLLGNDYSGLFSIISTIQAREWQSRCRFTIPDVKSVMPGGYQQKHCLHTATMEACFQSAFPALRAAGTMRNSLVLTSIEELQISTNTPSSPGSELCAEAEAEAFGHSKYSASLNVFNPDDEKRASYIEAKGLVYTALQDAAGSKDTDQKRSTLCHHLVWDVDLAFTSSEGIAHHCKKGISDIKPLHLRRNCDPFCRNVIRATLSGLSPSDEQRVSGDMKFFLRWMRSIDIVEPTGTDIDLEAQMRKTGAVGEVISHLGAHARRILLGDVQSLAIILEKDLLYRCYLDDDNLNRCHTQMINYIKLAQFKNPKIRILEVGGGTGSLTVPLLSALLEGHDARLGKYVFTDISTHFLGYTKALLEKFHSVMEFKRFDIEKQPQDQDLELKSFDLIVASNVLHVTSSLKSTLCNLRKLLKPEGSMVFLEITNPSLRWGILGGPLPGWWLGVNDGRESSPLLSTDRWDDVLKASGFSGVSLEMKDYESPEDHETSILVANNVPELPPRPSIRTVSIVTTEKTVKLSRQLANLLETEFPIISVSQGALLDTNSNHDAYIMLLDVMDDAFLERPSEAEWNRTREILCHSSSVLWVTSGSAVECSMPCRSLITGLARSLHSEDPQRKLFTLDIDPDATKSPEVATSIWKVLKNIWGFTALLNSDSEYEYALRDEKVLIPRLMLGETINNYVQNTVSDYHPRLESEVDPNRSLRLRLRNPGLLDSIFWADSHRDSSPPKEHEVRVKFEFIALNFRDLMVAMGQLGRETDLLIEGSGKIIEVGDAVQDRFVVGDMVCAFGPRGLATISNLDSNYVFHLPSGFDLSSSAAVIVAYSTALYCLRDVAHIQPGESILIHSAAGAVGQAAIAVAKRLGAGKIFVTVGTEKKRELVRDTFGIEDGNILSSRDHNFGQNILLQTKGQGVDVVLNSLAGDMLIETSSILAPFGRFIEIGKRDLISNGRLEMKHLIKNITFAVVDMVLLAVRRSELFQKVVQDALDIVGSVDFPFLNPITVKPASKLEEVFRLMQGGKHTGKLVIKLRPAMTIRVQPPTPSQALLRADSSYLIVGGTGGLGRALVRYLTGLGAGQIITLSRSGDDSLAVKELQKELSHSKTTMTVLRGSVVDRAALEKVNEYTQNLPLRGIIQGAMAVKSGLFKDTSAQEWTEALSAKVRGTIHLAESLSSNLDFFILLSSINGVTGAQALSSYCAGNAFLDAFARNRAFHGFPTISIDIGMVAGEGIVAENEKVASFQRRQGLRPHSLDEFLAVINYAITHPNASIPLDAQILCGARREDPASRSGEAARERSDAKFSHIYQRIAGNQLDTVGSKRENIDVQAALRAAKSPKVAISVTLQALRKKVAQLLVVPEKDLQVGRSMASYGMDSLVSVELQKWMSEKLGVHMQTMELMSSISMAQRAEEVARRSRWVQAGIFE